MKYYAWQYIEYRSICATATHCVLPPTSSFFAITVYLLPRLKFILCHCTEQLLNLGLSLRCHLRRVSVIKEIEKTLTAVSTDTYKGHICAV